jgi:predicted P-loop ATPase
MQPDKKTDRNESIKKSPLQQILSYLESKYEMRFNTISGEAESRQLGSNDKFKIVNQNDIYLELEHQRYSCSIDKLKIIFKSSFIKQYNPIEEYFKNLDVYDPLKEPNYLFNIGDYIVVRSTDSERFLTQFKKFIVRCVAQSLYHVVNKQALVIISPKQSSGKSTFCRWLCPTELMVYYSENMGIDKDGQIGLTENFITNLDELATMSKWDLDGLKSCMSKEIIKTRKPYDAKSLPYLRITNFVGSTNNIEFLTDVTGSVRWLCFEVDYINFKYKLDIPIDRLWAQAFYLFNDGYKYQLTAEEQAQNEISNQRHKIQTIEEELVSARYAPGTNQDHDLFLQTSQIYNEIIKEEPYLSNKINEFRLGRALIGLGFKKESKRVENATTPRKGYYVKFNIKH